MRALRLFVAPIAATVALTTILSTGALAGRAPIALGLTIQPEWGTSGAWWNRELGTIGGSDPSIMSLVFSWNGPRQTTPTQQSLDDVVFQPTGFPDASVLDRVYSRGAIPLLFWQPNLRSGETLQTILNGRYDDYITTWARAARADGRPMILRFAQEMNAGWFTWGATRAGNSPDDFVAVWQKVYNMFRGPDGAGASNVRFMWSPSVKSGKLATFDSVYPGNAYVQYIGLDGYNYFDFNNPNGKWRSIKEIFKASLDEIALKWPTKPVVISEVGSVNDHPGDTYDKGMWLQRGLKYLYENHPQVVGFVYFNIRVVGGENGVNWRLDSSDSALSTYRTLSSDPRYAGQLDMVSAAARTR